MLTVQTLKTIIKAYLDFKSCSNELLEDDTLETLRALFSEYEMASIPAAEQRAGGPA